jgi:hypothetical protein
VPVPSTPPYPLTYSNQYEKLVLSSKFTDS